MFECLVDVYFVVEEVDIGHVHVLQFYHLDGKTLALVVITDATVDTTAETATNQVFQVEAVPADTLLTFGRQLLRLWVVMGVLGVAGLDVKGAVGAAQLVGLGRCGDGDGN